MLITIRYGDEEDCPALLNLLHLAFGEYRGKIQPESSVFRETVDTLCAKMETQTLLLAQHTMDPEQPDVPGDPIVGCVLCYPQGDTLYFGRLAVDPDYRGRGIAQELIEHVEKEALGGGYDTVILEARILLKQNIAFFEGCGYEIQSSHAHDGYDYPTYFRMAKKMQG